MDGWMDGWMDEWILGWIGGAGDKREHSSTVIIMEHLHSSSFLSIPPLFLPDG